MLTPQLLLEQSIFPILFCGACALSQSLQARPGSAPNLLEHSLSAFLVVLVGCHGAFLSELGHILPPAGMVALAR